MLNDVGPKVDPAGLERIRGYAGKAAAVGGWPEPLRSRAAFMVPRGRTYVMRAGRQSCEAVTA